jgi:hypothetical protein
MDPTDDSTRSHLDNDDEAEVDPRVPADTIDWQLWPIAGVVAKRLGITKRELAQMVADEEIVRYRAKDRTWRFKPSDVDAIVRTTRMASRDIAASEIDPAVAQYSDPKHNKGLEGIAIVNAVRYLTESLDAAQKHVQRMVELVGKPIEKSLDVLQQTCSAQTSEIERLSRIVSEQREAAVQADTDRFYRELAVRDMDQAAKRRDAVAQLLIQKAGPALLAKAVGAPVDLAQLLGAKKPPAPEPPPNGHNGPTQAQVVAAVALLTSIKRENPELFQGLKETEGFFTAEQREWVDTITAEPAPPGQPETTGVGKCEKESQDV